MKTITSPAKMASVSEALRASGKKIGFVPTMGALHEGHLALVKEAGKHADTVVVSIFVNPIQFGPKEDLKKYPRNLKKDSALLKKLGTDILFYPSAKDIYPEGFNSFVEVKGITDKLCGASRPGHFIGVATVVSKFFNIVKPRFAVFGLKDFQQQAVIRRMVKDLNMDVEIKTIPVFREKDGLAMSSRNAYLSKEERKAALVLSRSLAVARELVRKGTRKRSAVLGAVKRTILSEKTASIDYISISDPETFAEKPVIKGPTLIALAVFIGKTRLIDNTVVNGG